MFRTAKTVFFVLLLVLVTINSLSPPNIAIAQQISGDLQIYGAVKTPLNLTYDQLLSFPMVSEIAELICVTGSPDVTYNWTGIPLLHLLTLAEIKPEAYKIVTRCSDGFYTDLLVEDALKPTTILALKANGTSLPQLTYGPAVPYRLIVPGKYGYKWASGVQAIEVVTTDEKGLWESSGFSDAADVPDYGPAPTLIPPLQTFLQSFENRTFEIDVYTNASINGLVFDYSEKALNINVTVPQNAAGFAEFILQQDFLRGPYNITLDGKEISSPQGYTYSLSYLYIPLDEGFHVTAIAGTEFFGHIPQIIVDYSATAYFGQNATFDASKSFDNGEIISYEWDFGDGTSAGGPVVFHQYREVGAFQVTLNVTNNEGISSFKILTVNVQNPPGQIPIPVLVFFAIALLLLILIFVILVRGRKKDGTSHAQVTWKDAGFPSSD